MSRRKFLTEAEKEEIRRRNQLEQNRAAFTQNRISFPPGLGVTYKPSDGGENVIRVDFQTRKKVD